MTRSARLTRLVVSWLMVGLGVPLLVRSNLGVAPFDVLNTGLNEVTELSFGLCFILMSAVFFGTGYLLGAKLGWACLGGTLTIGVMVNLVLRAVPERDALALRVPFLLGGILIIAVAICLSATELGAGPTEVMMLGLVNRRLGGARPLDQLTASPLSWWALRRSIGSARSCSRSGWDRW
jgi:uncharacterized membrane protein YczE